MGRCQSMSRLIRALPIWKSGHYIQVGAIGCTCGQISNWLAPFFCWYAMAYLQGTSSSRCVVPLSLKVAILAFIKEGASQKVFNTPLPLATTSSWRIIQEQILPLLSKSAVDAKEEVFLHRRTVLQEQLDKLLGPYKEVWKQRMMTTRVRACWQSHPRWCRWWQRWWKQHWLDY